MGIQSNMSIGMKAARALLFLAVLGTYTLEVRGHGRLLEPPSRSSMWRQGYSTPVNYNDNQMFCGGVGVQYGKNGGKCGVCGDPWNGPRENENGGKFATGIIVRKYEVGQVIDVVVELTANHKGYFEFKLCPKDSPFEKETQECLDKYPLVETSVRSTRYPITHDGYQIKIPLKLRLPAGVSCSSCLLQWKYNAGNSWGTNPDGSGCIGCGDQEQFYGCSDIAIGSDDVTLGERPMKHPWYFQDSKDEWHYGIVRYTNTSYRSPADSVMNQSLLGLRGLICLGVNVLVFIVYSKVLS